VFVPGMAAYILPFGALARRRGRRTAFMFGTGAGVLTDLLAAVAAIGQLTLSVLPRGRFGRRRGL